MVSVALRRELLVPSTIFWATTNLRNPSNGDERAREVPTHQEKRNKRENKPTQYLMRFDNLPTSSSKGERDFIDSTINYNLFLTLRNFQERFSVEYFYEGSNTYL